MNGPWCNSNQKYKIYFKKHVYISIADDEDYEPPAAAIPSVPKDKWEGEDSDDDNIKAAWDQVDTRWHNSLIYESILNLCLAAHLSLFIRRNTPLQF